MRRTDFFHSCHACNVSVPINNQIISIFNRNRQKQLDF